MRYNKTRKVLIFWCLFIGIGALFGSSCMLIDSSGKLLRMDTLLPYFKVLPFSDLLFTNYTFSGISLLIVNGLTNFVATYFLIKKSNIGSILGSIFGITLMLWITIQFIIFPTNVLSITYFIFGFIEFITGYMCYVFYSQEHFKFDKNDYNINSNSDTIVVYFSRLGYTKKQAYEHAEKNRYDIKEVTTEEPINGTSGFWWCGKYGLSKKLMPINNIDISKYRKIIIVSPIWVFNIASPIISFIETNKDKLDNIDLVLVHYTKMKYNYIFNNIEQKYHIRVNNRFSICIRLGKLIYKKRIN